MPQAKFNSRYLSMSQQKFQLLETWIRRPAKTWSSWSIESSLVWNPTKCKLIICYVSEHGEHAGNSSGTREAEAGISWFPTQCNYLDKCRRVCDAQWGSVSTPKTKPKKYRGQWKRKQTRVLKVSVFYLWRDRKQDALCCLGSKMSPSMLSCLDGNEDHTWSGHGWQVPGLWVSSLVPITHL